MALKGLTVDFHEPEFVGGLNGENRQAFWFQMSGKQQRQAGSPWGPANPQALNRYSYVQNNPLGATDPSGHLGISVNKDGSYTYHFGHKDIENLKDWLSNGLPIKYVGWGATVGAVAKIFPKFLGVLEQVLVYVGAIVDTLGLVDYYYGNNGVDVTCGGPYASSVPGGCYPSAPNQDRQEGYYGPNGERRHLPDLRPREPRSYPVDVPESQQWCNYGYNDPKTGQPVSGPC